MTTLKVTQLIQKDNPDQSIAIGPDDIVVFVGPNNSGKSQALRDIHRLLETDAKDGVVVCSVKTNVENKEHLEFDLRDFLSLKNGDFSGDGYTVYSYHIKNLLNENRISSGIVSFLSSFQSTTERLKLVDAPEKIEEGQIKTHPFHYIDRARKLLEGIDKAFVEGFGKHLLLNDYAARCLPMVLSDEILKVEVQDVDRRIEMHNENWRRVFSHLPSLQEQGDGMKSFVGILLNFFVEHYSVFFIDEPESFLHPPQAYVIGQQVEALSQDKQLFIATHSGQFLKGLIDTGTDRLKIIRVTRDGNHNKFTVLDSQQIRELWSDPLLRYSNIMDALFYEMTVVTESNADCKFYRILMEYLMHKSKKHRDILFVESGGKQRLHIVCKAFKSLDIDFRVTPDFDIFRQEGQVEQLYDSCGGIWDENCSDDWKEIDQSLPDNPDELDVDTVRANLNNILARVQGKSLGGQDIKKLKKALKGKNKWDIPKYDGLDGITDKKAKAAAKRLLDRFHAVSIYPVTTGEMESLVPEFDDHGKDWVNRLLNDHSDLSKPIYTKALEYIRSLGVIQEEKE